MIGTCARSATVRITPRGNHRNENGDPDMHIQRQLALKANIPATFPVSDSSPSVAMTLAPLMVAVFMGFLVIGAALPVLPLHVRDGLGFGPVMVGVVAG